jgi:hypothetical protein
MRTPAVSSALTSAARSVRCRPVIWSAGSRPVAHQLTDGCRGSVVGPQRGERSVLLLSYRRVAERRSVLASVSAWCHGNVSNLLPPVPGGCGSRRPGPCITSIPASRKSAMLRWNAGCEASALLTNGSTTTGMRRPTASARMPTISLGICAVRASTPTTGRAEHRVRHDPANLRPPLHHHR